MRLYCNTLLAALTAIVMLGGATPASAASSVLVWPIDPLIQQDERATAIWLENRGAQPILLQLRIFAWRQAEGEDVYDEQNDIVGTPPMIRIEPGKRQLVRLTRTTPVADGIERAFRVVIDEIPTPEGDGATAGAAFGVRYQIRYSLPLFAYGKGLMFRPNLGETAKLPLTVPALRWRLVEQQGKKYVEITNSGLVHARLTGVGFRQAGKTGALSEGLLGYVLAGSTMRWTLPDAVQAKGELIATVNGDPTPTPIAAIL